MLSFLKFIVRIIFNLGKYRPSLEQQSPLGYESMKVGKVRSKPILGGLWNHYFREAA